VQGRHKGEKPTRRPHTQLSDSTANHLRKYPLRKTTGTGHNSTQLHIDTCNMYARLSKLNNS